MALSITSIMFSFVFAASCAPVATSRETVRIVPSVGFITALYAASEPSFKATASSSALHSVLPLRLFDIPLKNCDRITPELPLAPLRVANDIVSAAFVRVVSPFFKSSVAIAVAVSDIFVPVSPSGTGKTLSSSTVFLLLYKLFAPLIII